MTEPRKQPATPPASTRPAGDAIADLLRPFQAEAAATRVAIEDRNREQRRTGRWLIGFIAVTALLVALVLAILVQNRQKSEETRRVIQTNAELSAKIADCTNITGKCYQQAQSRTQVAIQRLIDSNLVIAKCARSADTDAELDSCVNAKMSAPKVTPTR